MIGEIEEIPFSIFGNLKNIFSDFPLKFDNINSSYSTRICKTDPNDSQFMICETKKKIYNPETKKYQKEKLTERLNIHAGSEKIIEENKKIYDL